MTSDPVVDHVHRVREAIRARFDGDLQAVIADARQRQGADGRKVIRGTPLPPNRRRRPEIAETEKRAG